MPSSNHDPVVHRRTGDAPSSRPAKVFFATMLLIFVLFGLALYLLAPAIGMPAEIAHRMAGIMLVVCSAYALMLIFWDRVFARLG